MIPYFKEYGLNFFKNYTVREIPEVHKILVPYIYSFNIWYTSLHSLPSGLGKFENIEKILVNGGPIKHIKEEVWRLPKLKELALPISKNFVWDSNILLAKSLEYLTVTGVIFPSLPEVLPELEGLKSLSYRALGSPKDSSALPAFLWEAKNLEILGLSGKTIPLPADNCFEKFQALEYMDLASMNWDTIPESILEMKQLEQLDISNFIKLTSLPDWFAKLQVEELSFYNSKISNALEIIQQMPGLKILRIPKNIQKTITAEDWEKELNGIKINFV
jgi:Leucine-rich repeat (LRR) protein